MQLPSRQKNSEHLRRQRAQITDEGIVALTLTRGPPIVPYGHAHVYYYSVACVDVTVRSFSS